MSEYINTTKEITAEIKKISDSTKTQLKPLILKLAEHIAKGLIEKRSEAIRQATAIVNKGRYSKDPTNLKNVSKIIKAIRDKHFPTVSFNHIHTTLPEKYKETRITQEKEFDVNSISDKDLIDKRHEIIKRIKDLQPRGPAQDYKTKTIKDIEEDVSGFHLKMNGYKFIIICMMIGNLNVYLKMFS